MWKRKGRSKGVIFCWYEEVKEAISRKKDAHKAMFWNSAEGNKQRYESMKNRAKKTVSRAMI